MKKPFRFIIPVLLVAAMLASCGTVSDTQETTPDTTTEEIPAETDIFAGLERKNYGGQEFNLLVRDIEEEHFSAEEATGDVYNDAVYTRNAKVEDEFGVTINVIPSYCPWGDCETYMNQIRSSAMAGSGEYDLVDMQAAFVGFLLPDGILLNLNEVEYLRLDSPWWSEEIRENLTLNGKLFAATGDISVSVWNNMHVLYFNKQLAENYQLESPYELVKSGKWTYDRFLDAIKDTSKDLNGDNTITVDDQHGLLMYDSITFSNFGIAFDISTTVKDGDSITLNLMTEKIISLGDKLLTLIDNNPDVHYMNQSTPDIFNAADQLFASNHALFYTSMLSSAVKLRDMDADFGILPYPMADESQGRYYTSSRDGHSMLCILTDVKDASFSGMITEALCVAGSELVVPAYYEQVLKGKVSRDNESAEMLDIIREGLTLDFGMEYGLQTENAGYILRSAIAGERTAYATYYAAHESAFNTAFQTFLENFE